MPKIKSAKKALRQNKKRKIQNIKKKDAFKSIEKQIKKIIAGGNAKETKKLLPQLYKALDKAAKTNVIKKNTASRKKSRITKIINKAIGK